MGLNYLYMVEVFPSVFRGIGVGIVSVQGRMGATLAPIITSTMQNMDLYP